MLYRTWPWLAHIAPLRGAVPLQDAIALRRLRDYVVATARDDVLDEMRMLQRETNEDRRLSLQNSVNRKLAKLKPGTSSCLQAMLAPDGTLATSHEAMAALLRSHWAQIFTAPEAIQH
jgi:hypothetical protein